MADGFRGRIHTVHPAIEDIPDGIDGLHNRSPEPFGEKVDLADPEFKFATADALENTVVGINDVVSQVAVASRQWSHPVMWVDQNFRWKLIYDHDDWRYLIGDRCVLLTC